MQEEVASFLKTRAKESGTVWNRPVDAVARMALSVLDATVRRWAVDADAEAAVKGISDLVDYVVDQSSRKDATLPNR